MSSSSSPRQFGETPERPASALRCPAIKRCGPAVNRCRLFASAAILHGDHTSDLTHLKNAQAVQENSHTPQKALGFILRQLQDSQRAPRLAVATHFQASDDTIAAAMSDIRSWYGGPVTFATDLMVICATRNSVVPYRAVVPDYSWSARFARKGDTYAPKYADSRSCNPYAPMAPLKRFDDDLLADVIAPEAYDPGGWQDVNNNGACKDWTP